MQPFMKPLNGSPPVTGLFTDPRDGGNRQHGAIDIAVNTGTPIFSPWNGVIERVYWTSLGGNQIVIRHENGMFTGYAHLSDMNVNPGDRVVQGEQIGLSGNTGTSSGPHLHFTVKTADGTRVDPLPYWTNGIEHQDIPLPTLAYIKPKRKYGTIIAGTSATILGLILIFRNNE